MKTKILSLVAAAAISLGAVSAANTASADVVAQPAVAASQAEAGAHNVGVKLRIRIYKGRGYYPYYGYGYGSYRHCKFLLYKWKYEGRFWAKKRFYHLRCYRFFY